MMFKFKKNMGTVDRGLRVLAGVSLLTVGPLTNLVPTDTFSNVILSCMAAVALTSALISYCVLYEFTGFDTLVKK